MTDTKNHSGKSTTVNPTVDNRIKEGVDNLTPQEIENQEADMTEININENKEKILLIVDWEENCDCGSSIKHWNGGNYHYSGWTKIFLKNGKLFKEDWIEQDSRSFYNDNYQFCVLCQEEHNEGRITHKLEELPNDFSIDNYINELQKESIETVKEKSYPYQSINKYSKFEIEKVEEVIQ